MDIRETWRNLKAKGHRFVTLTAYDYPMAKLLDECGLDFILVGDSLGMVVLGFPDTSHVTMEMMLHHTAAAARGTQSTPLIADMPAGSISSTDESITHARLLANAGAKAVKVEGGAEVLPMIEAVLADGIPVVGHLGMLPQRVVQEGGYRIKGRTDAEAVRLLEDARLLDRAGVSAIVLELVTPPLAARITESVSVPTIGIGSGDGCDGQILVTHDLLGLFPWFTPKFVRPARHLSGDIQAAVREFAASVRG